ncbi:MAG: MBL fold metallo-hydrolase [Saprospiraceae bacterium]|nr:MBL fold metallo-hydrolase [Saprospiraceae bacterium]
MNTRREFLKTTGQVAAYSFLFGHLYACKGAKVPTTIQLPADASFNMQFLRGGVGFFTERGGTIGWMASKDGMAVIDTQFPEQSQHLVDELMKIKKGKIDLLINTHHHGDHTAGNKVYRDLTDTILAHENSKKNQENSAKKRGNEADQVYPNETFETSIRKRVGNEVIDLKYYGAGHTNGDAITHFQNANIVHMGDLVFNRRFPYIDTGAGANIENWIKVLDQAKRNYDDETIFIWGHAADGYDIKGGKEDISAFQNYLEKLLEFGEKSMRAGVTLDELIKTTTTIPGAEEWTGKGIDRSLKAVYAEVGKE